jgi:uncharacterized protein
LTRLRHYCCPQVQITANNGDIMVMKLETDLKKIEQLSKQREKANWEFRCFLKQSDYSVKEIDSVVKDLYTEISSQIDCTKCANCCKIIHPVLSEADIKRLARHQGLSCVQFKLRFVTTDEDHDSVFNQTPCPFLENNSCTVYEHRPGDCRSYPHLHKRQFVFRMNQAFLSCSVCPIAFNVYERLKQILGPGRLR